MPGGSRARNHPPARRGRRPSGPAVALAVLVLGVLLAGCADPTGQIDADGHNGYDEMACEKGKALALDLQYGTVAANSAQRRVDNLATAAGKAGHPEVRDAATALLLGYRAKDKARITAASQALIKACEM